MAQQRKSFLYGKVSKSANSKEGNNNPGKHPFLRRTSQLKKEILSRKLALEYVKVSKKWN